MIDISTDFTGLKRAGVVAASGFLAFRFADPVAVVVWVVLGWQVWENHKQHLVLVQYGRLRRGLRRAVEK